MPYQISLEHLALLGKCNEPEWTHVLAQRIQGKFSSLGAVDGPFISWAVHPSKVDFFPEGIDRHLEIIYAQEKLIADRSDVVIYANDGVWDKTGNKKRHLRNLTQHTSVLIIWTPSAVKENIDVDDPIISGVVAVNGDYGLVTDIVAYICLAHSNS